jgi:hypothetical protein
VCMWERVSRRATLPTRSFLSVPWVVSFRPPPPPAPPPPTKISKTTTKTPHVPAIGETTRTNTDEIP